MTRLSQWLLDNSRRIGVAMVVVALLFGVGLFNRDEIATRLSSTERIEVTLARDYNLAPYETAVKVAGVQVGVVTDVRRGVGGVDVTLAVDPGTREVLGTAPEAAVRPVTLLGGNVYVSLAHGGDDGAFDGRIPRERSSLPVELDHVLATLQQDALEGTATAVRELDGAMREGGDVALDRLVEVAPDTLTVAAPVLDALHGRDGTDLGRLVDELESVATTLTDDPDLLEGLVAGTAGTAAALGATAPDQARAVERLPQSLIATRGMLRDLEATMGELRAVAEPLRPSVIRLGEVLEQATPVLERARPVVADLAPTARDARPVVGELSPTVADLGRTIDDVRGPVIARLEEDLVPALLSNYRGEDALLYEEIGYLLAGMAGTAKYTDSYGAALSFQLGVGFGSVPELVDTGFLRRPVDPDPRDLARGGAE